MAQNLIESPIKTYPRFNSGRFADASPNRIENDSYVLSPTETAVVEEITERLQHQNKVIVLDLGAMFAMSLVIIGDRMSPYVQQNRLVLIVTNLESNFTPEATLYMAKTRASQNIYPQLRLDVRDIEFLERNMRYVTYLFGVSSTQLRSQNLPPIDIVHENFGGFYHSKGYGQEAVREVSAIMKAGGTLYTTASLVDDPHKYGNAATKCNLIPEKQYKWQGDGYYQIYHKA